MALILVLGWSAKTCEKVWRDCGYAEMKVWLDYAEKPFRNYRSLPLLHTILLPAVRFPAEFRV